MGTVPDVSKAGYVLCPEGQHTFEVEVFEEKADSVTLLLKHTRNQGNVFKTFSTDPEDEWAWTLKDFLEKVGLNPDGGYPWNSLNGLKIVAWIVHKESKGTTYANTREFESVDGAGTSEAVPEPAANPNSEKAPF